MSPLVVLKNAIEVIICSRAGAAQRLAWARIFILNLFGGNGSITPQIGAWAGTAGIETEETLRVAWEFDGDPSITWVRRFREYLFLYLKHEVQEAVYVRVTRDGVGTTFILGLDEIANVADWALVVQQIDRGEWLSQWFEDHRSG